MPVPIATDLDNNLRVFTINFLHLSLSSTFSVMEATTFIETLRIGCKKLEKIESILYLFQLYREPSEFTQSDPCSKKKAAFVPFTRLPSSPSTLVSSLFEIRHNPHRDLSVIFKKI